MSAIVAVAMFKGYNSKNKKLFSYPNISSALRPVVNDPVVPLPQPTETLEDASTNSSDSGRYDKEFQWDTESQSPQLYTYSKLNDEIRDLGLPKGKTEFLSSCVQENNLLAPGISMYCDRSREHKFTRYFLQDGYLVFCCNIPRLMQKFGVKYKLCSIQSVLKIHSDTFVTINLCL
jgi:hypothetical protein